MAFPVQAAVVYQVCNSDGSRRQSYSMTATQLADDQWEIKIPDRGGEVPHKGDKLIPQGVKDCRTRTVTAVADPVSEDAGHVCTCSVAAK